MTMAQRHRARPAPDARHRAQQDAGRAAVQRVPHVLPGQRGRVLRLLLRLLPARGVRPERATSTSRRTRRSTRRSTGCATPRPPPASPAATSSSSPRCRHLRPRLARDLRREHADPQARRDHRPRRAAAQARRRSSTRATTSRSGRANFRVRGETLEVFPAYAETAYRATFFGDEVERLQHFDPLTGELIEDDLEHVAIWPASHYNVKDGTIERAVEEIGRELNERCAAARGRGQAARVAPPAPAHAVRHGDAARDGLLQRHRELLAHPRRPRARLAAVLPDRLLPRRLPVLHRRVAPDRPADRRHVRTATARARRRSSTTASGCRARWTTARRRSTSAVDHAAGPVRLGDAGRLRAQPLGRDRRADRPPDGHRRPAGRRPRDAQPDRRPHERGPQGRRPRASASWSRRSRRR